MTNHNEIAKGDTVKVGGFDWSPVSTVIARRENILLLSNGSVAHVSKAAKV